MSGAGQTTSALARWTLMGAALTTLALGVWMRWALTGSTRLPFEFAHLRHAHSHLGYFALLFPLAWGGWSAAGAPVPGRAALVLYAFATCVSFVGFTLAGYGPVSIAGSTVVAIVWLWSAWPLLPRIRHLRDPLGGVPLGIVLALACVPPIAAILRSDPSLAQALVSTFLAALLFLVVVPSAFAAFGEKRVL
ncbi:MAG: hypothetical protein AAF658_13370, partial [Myxococcota bacterium]